MPGNAQQVSRNRTHNFDRYKNCTRSRALAAAGEISPRPSSSVLDRRLTLKRARPQALVDRPDEIRRVINFKRLALTDLKVDIPRLAKKKVLKEALATSGMRHACV